MKDFYFIGNDWDDILAEIFNSDCFKRIKDFLKLEYQNEIIYPPLDSIFNAFKLTPYSKVRSVILGQDPYHGENQANGLAFSVNENIKLPPSLVNIYKELKSDLNIENKSGSLEGWAKQGVLLLNTSLTVKQNLPSSHKNCGWIEFTDNVIRKLSNRLDPIVFILWGANARKKIQLIDCKKHFIIQSAHPSPLSSYNGFFGSKPFSKTNDYLLSLNHPPIDWQL